MIEDEAMCVDYRDLKRAQRVFEQQKAEIRRLRGVLKSIADYPHGTAIELLLIRGVAQDAIAETLPPEDSKHSQT